MDCLFCKIIKGEIPCYKVFENEQVLAFLDIQPANPGHVLVIPKKHSDTLVETEPAVLAEIAKVLPKIGGAIMKSLDYEGFNLQVNNGKVAGQVIPHLHFHIIPRKNNDGHKLFKGDEMSSGQLEEVVDKIKESF